MSRCGCLLRLLPLRRGDVDVATSARQTAPGQDDATEGEAEYVVRVDGFEIRGRARLRRAYYVLTVTRGELHWPIRRRYRQVMTLHSQIRAALGRSPMLLELPRPPPKVTCRSLVKGGLDDRFLVARAEGIQEYFSALLRYIPHVDQCEALHEFLCGVDVDGAGYEALLELGRQIGVGAAGPGPAQKELIAQLPRSAALSPASAAEAEVQLCVVCQEHMDRVNDDVRILPCGHEYHFGCISEWLQQSNTCCVCNSPATAPAEATGPAKSSGEA